MENALAYLKENIYKSYLESFGVNCQFIELVFSNSNFEEIKFFLDCKISTPNSDISKLISPLSILDEDTFEIGYFIYGNLKAIVDCKINSENNFEIIFENNYHIIFDLNSSQEPLSISFKEKIDDIHYASVVFGYGGKIHIKR